MTKFTIKTLGWEEAKGPRFSSGGVDSGQLIIVDPCYLGSWKDGESTDKKSHYGKACDASLSEERAGEILVSGIAGSGVVFSTGGDGGFPVYAHYRKDDSISKIEISAFW